MDQMVCIAMRSVMFNDVSAPAGASNIVKVSWVAFGYFLFALFYTTVNLPYGSMLPLMTKNSVDRASLSSFRMIGAYIGIFIVNATALPMVAFFGNMLGGRVYAYTLVTGIMCVRWCDQFLYSLPELSGDCEGRYICFRRAEP